TSRWHFSETDGFDMRRKACSNSRCQEMERYATSYYRACSQPHFTYRRTDQTRSGGVPVPEYVYTRVPLWSVFQYAIGHLTGCYSHGEPHITPRFSGA